VKCTSRTNSRPKVQIINLFLVKIQKNGLTRWGRLIWIFFAVKNFPETVSPGTRKFCSSYFSAPPSFTVSGKTLYQFQHMRQMLPHPPCSSPNYIYGFRQNLVPISTHATNVTPPPLLFPQLYLRFPAKFSTNFNTSNKVTPHPPCSSLNYIYGFRQNLVPISTQ
jgi:hypothetical protein